MNPVKHSVLIALLILFIGTGMAQTRHSLPLIPYPAKVKILPQGQFNFTTKTVLLLQYPAFKKDAEGFSRMVKEVTGLQMQDRRTAANNNIVSIGYSDTLKNDEAYTLNITSQSIEIKAKTGAGIFYATQTINQLLSIGQNRSISAMTIEDEPAYPWRGFMLDVSRHFFAMDYLYKLVDRLSFYKANKLHLHLTDDQGWRMEIKKYPLLTSKGAWRKFNKHDSACMKQAEEDPDLEIDRRFIKNEDGSTVYGGFYTQAQLKALVQYATRHHIEIIPEIDMPGHFMAAVNAYPFLADGKSGWEKNFSIPINPAVEDVYPFLENILTEVFDVFPSKYIHIGADEVEKTSWKESDKVAAFTKANNIATPESMQSYFVHRMQQFVESKGHTLITWDDALEGGLNNHVAIMYWRSWKNNAISKALENGNPLIMSPEENCYFNHPPDNTGNEKTYGIDMLDSGNNKFIQGGQANLWSEYIPGEQRADYLIFPRYLALAERLWTRESSNYSDFENRLKTHYPILNALGIKYRLPDIPNIVTEQVFERSTKFFVSPAAVGDHFQIRYAVDSGKLSGTSKLLTDSILITKDSKIQFAVFDMNGRQGNITTVHLKNQLPFEPLNIARPDLKEGLHVNYYEGFFGNTSKIKSVNDSAFDVYDFRIPQKKYASSFAMIFNGYIDIPETGTYSFFLNSNDAGVLLIDKELVVDNDGMHATRERNGQIILKKGWHSVQLKFIEGGGGYLLNLKYRFKENTLAEIPAAWLYHTITK